LWFRFQIVRSSFSYGIGTTIEEAEKAMMAQKASK